MAPRRFAYKWIDPVVPETTVHVDEECQNDKTIMKYFRN